MANNQNFLAEEKDYEGKSNTLQIVKKNEFSIYCLFDHIENKFVYLESGNVDEKALVEKLKPERINIFNSGNKAMLVPVPLFSTENVKEIFQSQYQLLQNEELKYDRLNQMDSWLLYAVHSKQIEKNENAFSGAKTRSSIQPWIEGLLKINRESKGKSLFVYIGKGIISVAVFSDSNLLFFNLFECNTSEDILYFIMFASDQLNVSPSSDKFFFTGLLNKDDNLFSLLTTYIKDVNLLRRPDFFNYGESFNSVSGHTFFTAFCTPLCE